MEFKLLLIREKSNENFTFGVLFINGYYQNLTLENTKLIIPEGNYKIKLYESPRNKRIVPLLLDVPNKTMIEVHIANYPYELKGCIAVGNSKSSSQLINSKVAFDNLMKLFSTDSSISIKIINQNDIT